MPPTYRSFFSRARLILQTFSPHLFRFVEIRSRTATPSEPLNRKRHSLATVRYDLATVSDRAYIRQTLQRTVPHDSFSPDFPVSSSSTPQSSRSRCRL